MTIETPAEAVAETPDTEGKDTGKGLRGQLEKQIAATKVEQDKNAVLRTQLLDRSYTELGLDPTKLVGKAIAENYDGEPTTEALAAYAKEQYSYEPVAAAPAAHPLAGQIESQQNALDQIGQTAGSVPVAPAQGDVLAKAEAEGDYATTMAIKGAQVADMFRP